MIFGGAGVYQTFPTWNSKIREIETPQVLNFEISALFCAQRKSFMSSIYLTTYQIRVAAG